MLNTRFVDVSASYHGADHAADVDGVAASGNIVRRVLQVLVVDVQDLHANLHHVVLKLDGSRQELGMRLLSFILLVILRYIYSILTLKQTFYFF